MNVWKPIALVAVAGLVASVGAQVASANGSVQNDQHPNLTHASEHLTAAAADITAAQTANEFDLGGHAAKAKELIGKAQAEVAAARQAAGH